MSRFFFKYSSFFDLKNATPSTERIPYFIELLPFCNFLKKKLKKDLTNKFILLKYILTKLFLILLIQ